MQQRSEAAIYDLPRNTAFKIEYSIMTNQAA